MKHIFSLTTLFLIYLCSLRADAQALSNEPQASATETSLAEVIVYKKVGERELKLHVEKPSDWTANDHRPAIVFFFGGGWVGGTPEQFRSQSEYLSSRGVVGIRVEYRTIPKGVQGPPIVCVQDAKSAMRWVRSHSSELGVDPKRIAAGGGSAGGHLAAFVGMVEGQDDPQDDVRVSPKANALVLFNPVFDNGTEGGWGQNRVGDRINEFSPAHNISVDDPPAIVFLGRKDSLIPVATVERFQSNMQSAGVRCETFFYDQQPHGFFNKEPYKTMTLREADKFLASLGWLEGAPTLKEPDAAVSPPPGAEKKKKPSPSKAVKPSSRKANLASLADYPYETAEPQKTGWPLTDNERAYVVDEPEHERRPGRESNKHLPQLWPVIPTAGHWGGTSWLDTHTKLVDYVQAKPGPIDVLLIGDSITQQWGSPLDTGTLNVAWSNQFANYKAINIGVGGDKTQNVLWRLDHGGVEGLEPKVVILMIGNNNMFFTAETGVEAAAKGIQMCVHNVRRKFPSANVIVAKILPCHAPGNRFYDDIVKTNAALDSLMLENDPNVGVLDLTGDFTSADGNLKKSLFTADNIHLSLEGYEVYAARLKPLLDNLLMGKTLGGVEVSR